jgi:hypothetical protein
MSSAVVACRRLSSPVVGLSSACRRPVVAQKGRKYEQHVIVGAPVVAQFLSSACRRLSSVLASCWPRAGLVLASCWPRAGLVLASCWPRADLVLALFWLCGPLWPL